MTEPPIRSSQTSERARDARLAHDLRSPLTVIFEFASILRDQLGGPLTELQQSYLKHIESAANDLSRLIDQRVDPSTASADGEPQTPEAQENHHDS